MKNNCRYGDKCRYSHDVQGQFFDDLTVIAMGDDVEMVNFTDENERVSDAPESEKVKKQQETNIPKSVDLK